MTLLRAILPALALAGSALAQCSVKATTTLESAAAASALAGCETFSGSVAFATPVAGDIDLSGIKEITGSLVASGATNITSITASNLQMIGGDFHLQQLTSMNTLSFPELTTVGGEVLWLYLPGLQMLDFTTGLGQAGSINIRATNLQNLMGLNLTQCGAVTIANNAYLTDITLDLTQVSGFVIISSNSQDTSCSFPHMTAAGGLQISNCSSLDVTSLKNTTGAAIFTGNYFNNFSAPHFAQSNGLVFNNNDQMTSLSMPSYTTSSGALDFINNIALTGTISLPTLKQVGGSATFVGNYSNVALPELNTILGTLTLESSKNIDSVCNHYSSMSGNGQPIHGKVQCRIIPTGTSSGSSPTGTSSSSGGSTSSGAAVANLDSFTASRMGLMGALAALFGLLL